MSPRIVLFEFFSTKFGIKQSLKCLDSSNNILKFIRYYFLDMMWAYSLMFTLTYILSDSNTALIISVIFSITIELFQLSPLIKGTFDVYDILAEIITVIIAFFIIKKNNTMRR